MRSGEGKSAYAARVFERLRRLRFACTSGNLGNHIVVQFSGKKCEWYPTTGRCVDRDGLARSGNTRFMDELLTYEDGKQLFSLIDFGFKVVRDGKSFEISGVVKGVPKRVTYEVGVGFGRFGESFSYVEDPWDKFDEEFLFAEGVEKMGLKDELDDVASAGPNCDPSGGEEATIALVLSRGSDVAVRRVVVRLPYIEALTLFDDLGSVFDRLGLK